MGARELWGRAEHVRPFALWSSFLDSYKPESSAQRELRAVRDNLAGAALDARAISRENQHLQGESGTHAR